MPNYATFICSLCSKCVPLKYRWKLIGLKLFLFLQNGYLLIISILSVVALTKALNLKFLNRIIRVCKDL